MMKTLLMRLRKPSFKCITVEIKRNKDYTTVTSTSYVNICAASSEAKSDDVFAVVSL